MEQFTDPPQNPYAAPQAELHPRDVPLAIDSMKSPERGNRDTILVVWFIVFVLNLPLATFFGVLACKGIALLGIPIAIVGLFLLTWNYIKRSGRFAGSWIAGALCVALSQFYPMLHLALGDFAMRLCQKPQGNLNLGEALFCSLFVGGGLIVISLALAGLFYAVFVSWDKKEKSL